MALRFRKAIKVAPGLSLNLGKKSASVRVGGKGFGHTVGTAGRSTSAGIPGTGLGITTRHRNAKSEASAGGGSAIVGLLVLVAIGAALWMFWPR